MAKTSISKNIEHFPKIFSHEATSFFPYGISNFAEIVRDDFVYVDKTSYIELLEVSREKK
ncbi:MAG: AAA family ATPase [Raineya sp.]|nr:AAA family ATPase [Raineya sp.]